MRIAISARGLNVVSGGVKEFIKHMIIQLSHKEVEEIIVYYDSRKLLGSFSDNEKVTEVYVPGSPKILWDHLFLPLRIRRDKPDITIFPKNVTPLLPVGKTMVIQADLAYFFPGLKAYKTFDTIYMKSLMPRSAREADIVTAISRSTRNDMYRVYKNLESDKVEVLYLAGSYQADSEPSTDAVREKYKLGTKPFIFFSGSLSPRKNIQRILKALATIKDEIPHDFVVTGGKSWSDDDINSLTKELGFSDRLIRLGFVDDEDMPSLYAAADIYLHPSLYEGFGMTVLEAFSAGCPVITSNVSSLPEVAGDAAILVDPYDTDAIAKAVTDIYGSGNLRASLVEKGYEQLREFSWEMMGNKVYELIKNELL